MTSGPDNLFANLPNQLPEELISPLVENSNVRIERIVSQGHRSPDGFWYDQHEDEWVLLLQGRASLRFDEEPESRELEPGDWVHIPAHRRHRVESTADDELTIWLAVFSPAVSPGS